MTFTLVLNKGKIKILNYVICESSFFNGDLSHWDVSNVTRMSEMFQAATHFNQDLSSWNVSNMTDVHGMFHKATNFDLNHFCKENIGQKPKITRHVAKTQNTQLKLTSVKKGCFHTNCMMSDAAKSHVPFLWQALEASFWTIGQFNHLKMFHQTN